MAFACSTAFAETAFDYAGIWSLIAVEEGGQIKNVKEAGVADMTIVLETDGTCKMYSVMENRDESGTWVMRFGVHEGKIYTVSEMGTDLTIVLQKGGACAMRSLGRPVFFCARRGVHRQVGTHRCLHR